MTVQDNRCVVDALCLREGPRFVDKPAEERHHALVVIEDEALRMPLNSEQSLVLVALHGFDDAIGTLGRNLQMLSRIAYCLMVERVDSQRLFVADDALKGASFLDVDRMRSGVSRHVL